MNEHEKGLMAVIGRNVGRLMESRNLSAEQLAEASSVDRGQIDRLLRGEGELRVDALFLLAGALGVAPDVLLGGISWVSDEEEGGGEYRVEGPGGG